MTTSIRTRLITTLFVVLIVAAIIASGVRYVLAQRLSESIYDNTLKVVALTISRDVLISDGGILAEELLDNLVSALGDPIYYRIVGPGGRFITGYSEGPRGSLATDKELETGQPIFYDGVYFNEPIRGVIFREFLSDAQFDGWTTVEVWQTIEERRNFSYRLLTQTIAVLAFFLVSVLITSTIAINFGLKPLYDLSLAVSRRTPKQLSPVLHEVPKEVAPLVIALNDLIDEVRDAIERREVFIADVAHQLRNPITAVAALLDVASGANSEEERRAIVDEAQVAMNRVRRLTKQLLSLETLDGRVANKTRVDLKKAVAECVMRVTPSIFAKGGEVDFEACDAEIEIMAPVGFIEEAIDNLLDNARLYGLKASGNISVLLSRERDNVVLKIKDDGPGIPRDKHAVIFDRFIRNVEDGHMGSGLGLAIAVRIIQMLDGQLSLSKDTQGAEFVIVLPHLAKD